MPTDVMLSDKKAPPIPARLYRSGSAKSHKAVVLHLGGSFDIADAGDSQVAGALSDAGAAVFSIDYRRQECRYPSAVDVAFAAISFLGGRRGSNGSGIVPIIVAGEERGGTIAAGLALRVRDQDPAALDGQLLLSPLLDPCMGSRSMGQDADDRARQTWADGWASYLGTSDVCHPYAVPSNSRRLERIIPTLVVSSEDDPLRDESLRYAGRLEQAGGVVTQHLLPAGTGWPSIYRGGDTGRADWRSELARLFDRFVQELGRDPQ